MKITYSKLKLFLPETNELKHKKIQKDNFKLF